MICGQEWDGCFTVFDPVPNQPEGATVLPPCLAGCAALCWEPAWPVPEPQGQRTRCCSLLLNYRCFADLAPAACFRSKYNFFGVIINSKWACMSCRPTDFQQCCALLPLLLLPSWWSKWIFFSNSAFSLLYPSLLQWKVSHSIEAGDTN